jgi:N-acetyl-gamma-glutamyl-phosphate reductase
MEPGQYERIFASRRVSNPGCYPTGFLALIRPLVREGIVPPDWPISVSAISGYSGGGKAMIEEFEDKSSPRYTNAVVRSYSLTLAHKHLPEMKTHSGLSHAPVFSPNVGRFYRGLLVDVPLPLWALPSRPTVMTVHQVLSRAYKGRALVKVGELTDGATMPSLDAEMLNHTNGMKLFVFGNDRNGQARLVALLDNLGKGASGAAVQNLNIMLGLPETAGLA